MSVYMAPIDPPEGGFGALVGAAEKEHERTLREAAQRFEAAAERAREDEAQHQADRQRIATIFGRPAGRLRRLRGLP